MQHSAQLQLNDLWGIAIGIVLFILMLGWREILDWLRVGVNRFVVVRRADMLSKIDESLGADSQSGGADTGADGVVLERQHQEHRMPVPNFESALDFFIEHNITDEQAIDLLANLKRNDVHLISANKIRDIVGGNEGAVKARVAFHRPKPAGASRTRPGRLERPVNGW